MSTAISSPSSPVDSSHALVRGVLWSVALNTVIPVVLYQFSKRFISPSEFTALVLATLFPVIESIWGLARERQLDPIAVIVLLGLATDAGAMLLGGSPQMLLLRESLFTGAFGAACFVSLLLPRPLMFYLGRAFMTGSDPVRRAHFNASWQLPEVRRGNRLVTAVWGVVFTGELALRIALIYAVSAAWVLVISPLLLGVLTVATIVWSFAYARRMRRRVLPLLLNQAVNPGAA